MSEIKRTLSMVQLPVPEILGPLPYKYNPDAANLIYY